MRTQKEIYSLAIEARAKIIWGKHPSEIRKWLSEKGVSISDIERIVSDAIQERSLEFRKRGLMEILLGLLILICICAIIAGSNLFDYFDYLHFRIQRFLGVLVCIGLYGFYRTCKGLFWIIQGSKSEGSLAKL